MKTWAAIGVAAAVGGYGALQWLGRSYGATRDERRRRRPGDDVCAHPQFVTTHATTINAPRETVWPNRHLVLHSTEHLPPGWAERLHATLDFTWAFVLEPVDDDRTRFIFRSRCRLTPWTVAAFYLAAMVPADFVMSRQMMRGLTARAEHNRRPAPVAPVRPDVPRWSASDQRQSIVVGGEGRS